MDMQHTTISPTPRVAIIGDNTLMALGLRGLLEAMMPTVEVGVYTTATELHIDERMGKRYFHYFVMTRALLTDMTFFAQNSRRCIVLIDNSTALLPADFHTLDMSQSEGQLMRDLMRLQHQGHQGRDVPEAARPHLLPQQATAPSQLPPLTTYTEDVPAPFFASHPDILPPTHVSRTTHYVAQPEASHSEPTLYHHPDILPDSGMPSDHHRPLPHYTTGSIHPDIIDLNTSSVAPSPAPRPAEERAPSQSRVSPEVLTHREREVLIYMAKGYTNKEIAARLNIGLTTVITHRRNLIEKLGIRSISALTVYAVTHGLLPIEEIDD